MDPGCVIDSILSIDESSHIPSAVEEEVGAKKGTP
jgi:hypothetical protein